MTRPQKITVLLILLLTLLCLGSGCDKQALSWGGPETAPMVKIAPANHRDLSRFLAGNDYHWETLDQGVPPFLLTTLPEDLHSVRDIAKRKRLFFLSLLPSVLLANQEILWQRQQLLIALRHQDAGLPLSIPQRLLISHLVTNYRLRHNPLTDPKARQQLLRRLDVLPADLVLAQAAIESGYGTSRFAQLGNNLFGQWTYAQGTGLVPENRPAGQRHEVAMFPSLHESVRAYMNNLNSHPAYRPLRTIREQKRTDKLGLRGLDLAAGLRLYSSRRDAYVAEVRSIIRRNQLSQLTALSLRTEFIADSDPIGAL